MTLRPPPRPGSDAGPPPGEPPLPAAEYARLYEEARRDAEAARREAEEARREARAAQGVKAAFLSTMSHELRTPLAAILGYEELLADGLSGPVNPTQAGQLRRIRASALHLLALVDEVLDFARISAGEERPQRAEVDLARTVAEAAEAVAPLAAAKGVELRVAPLPAAVPLISDAARLRQILAHLLGNAAKFTERGSIELAVEVAGPRVAFTVRDTGIGIAPEQRERVFEPFAQVEGSTTRRFGGAGLGLSVSRELARLLGGELHLASSPGQGSTLTLTLPLRGA